MALPIWQRTITTESGDVIPGAEITVVNEATGLNADIFSNRTGTTPRTNPFFTGADGFAQFYAAPGEYRIEAVGPTGSITWRWNVLTGDAATRDVTTSNTDTDTSRVMRPGNFGVGAISVTPLGNTLSTDERSALGALGRVDTDTNDRPLEIGNGMFFEAAHNVSRAFQIVASTSTSSASPVYVRTTNDAISSGWRELYHAGNSIASKDSSITTHLAEFLEFNDSSQRHTLIDINSACYLHGGIVLGEQAICDVIVDGVNLGLSTSGSRRSGVISDVAATLIPPVLAKSSLIVRVGTGRSAGTRSEGEIGASAYTSLII